MQSQYSQNLNIIFNQLLQATQQQQNNEQIDKQNQQTQEQNKENYINFAAEPLSLPKQVVHDKSLVKSWKNSNQTQIVIREKTKPQKNFNVNQQDVTMCDINIETKQKFQEHYVVKKVFHEILHILNQKHLQELQQCKYQFLQKENQLTSSNQYIQQNSKQLASQLQTIQSQLSQSLQEKINMQDKILVQNAQIQQLKQVLEVQQNQIDEIEQCRQQEQQSAKQQIQQLSEKVEQLQCCEVLALKRDLINYQTIYNRLKEDFDTLESKNQSTFNCILQQQNDVYITIQQRQQEQSQIAQSCQNVIKKYQQLIADTFESNNKIVNYRLLEHINAQNIQKIQDLQLECKQQKQQLVIKTTECENLQQLANQKVEKMRNVLQQMMGEVKNVQVFKKDTQQKIQQLIDQNQQQTLIILQYQEQMKNVHLNQLPGIISINQLDLSKV